MVRELNNRFHNNVYFSPPNPGIKKRLREPFNENQNMQRQLNGVIKVQHEVGVNAFFDFDYFNGDACACFTFRDKLIVGLLVVSFVCLFVYKTIVNRVIMVSKIPFPGS